MIAKIVLFMCLLLLPTQSWGALTVDGRNKGAPDIGNDTVTQSVTVNTASPFVVCVFWQGTQTLTDLTWNGSSVGSPLVTKSSGDGVDIKLAPFVIKNPATGTHDLVATFSAAPTYGAQIMWVTTTGGDTTTSYRTIYSRVGADGTGPGQTIVDSQSGDLVVQCAAVYGLTISFDGSQDSTSTETDNFGSNSVSWGISTLSASGAGTAMGATDAGTYAEAAFALIPASAGVAPSRMLMGVGQ